MTIISDRSVMFVPHTSKQNHLLAAQPQSGYERPRPGLERVPLKLGWALYGSGGKITVLDRPKLEARVCECCAVVKRETDRLLSRETTIVERFS